METTKIIKDQKQTRTTVPAKMVKEAGVETGHIAHWKLKKGKISADIMSHEEFLKAVAKDSGLISQGHNALSEAGQSKSDLNAIKNQIGNGKNDVLCETSEDKE